MSDVTRRPRLLDLFCGAGGAAKGYQRAGFYVVGVDINPQPNYCGDEFHQLDALRVLDPWHEEYFWSLWMGVDAVHASPPCQDYSRAMRHLSAPQPRLVEPVRALLKAIGLPYVIENVPGAPLLSPTLLCGSMFGLKIHRHRLFESSFPLAFLLHSHNGLAMNPHNQRGRDRIYAELGRADPEKPWRAEMGVEWMGRYEAREAIPPAYTEWIGTQLSAVLKVAA